MVLLNKINYKVDPRTINKGEAVAKALGPWKDFQTSINEHYNPALHNGAHYVVFARDNKTVPCAIDLDVITRKKLLDDDEKAAEMEAKGRKYEKKYAKLPEETRAEVMAWEEGTPCPWDPNTEKEEFRAEFNLPSSLVNQSGSGGFHLYFGVDDESAKPPTEDQPEFWSNGAFLRFFKHFSVDFRGIGGLLFGAGTQWKDTNQYITIEGSDDAITILPGWHLAYVLNKLNKTVCKINLGEFINGNIGLHGTVSSKNEFIVWREAMYLLKEMGYSKVGVERVFSHIPGYNKEKTHDQVNSYWNKERDPKRVQAKETQQWPDTEKKEVTPENTEKEVDYEEQFRRKTAWVKADLPVQQWRISKLSSFDGLKTVKLENIIRHVAYFKNNEQEVLLHQMAKRIGLTIKTLKTILEQQISAINRGQAQTKITKPLSPTDSENAILTVQENDTTEYRLYETGVTIRKIHYKDDGDITVTEDIAFAWNSFKIVNYCEKSSYYGEEPTFTFKLNGPTYRNRCLEDVKRIMCNKAMIGIASKANILNKIINDYITVCNVPKIESSPVCGFTGGGWVMPHTHEIEFSRGIQDEIAQNLLYVATMPPCPYLASLYPEDPYLAKQCLIDLYEATTVKYKGIVFAYAFVAPFMYALQPITKLTFNLALYSPDGGTGKSALAESVSTRWWDNMSMELLTASNFNSTSRAEDYLSSSTFIAPIDECDKMEEKILATIKSYTTGRAKVQKKKQDQSLATNKYLSNPQIHTFNIFPSIYDDPRLRERSLVVPVNDVTTEEQAALYNEVLGRIPRGIIGHDIYTKTQDWTFAYLRELYKSVPHSEDHLTNRGEAIYRLICLGALIAKELYGLELDVSATPELIHDTVQSGNDDIFSQIITQINVSKTTNWDAQEVSIFVDGTDTGQKKHVFDSRMNANTWVNAEVKECTREINGEKIACYKYSYNNLKDLLKTLPNKDKTINLPELRARLKPRWSNTVYGHVKQGSFVFIPITYIPIDKKKTASKGNKNKETTNPIEVDVEQVVKDYEEQQKNPSNYRIWTLAKKIIFPTIVGLVQENNNESILLPLLKERLLLGDTKQTMNIIEEEIDPGLQWLQNKGYIFTDPVAHTIDVGEKVPKF